MRTVFRDICETLVMVGIVAAIGAMAYGGVVNCGELMGHSVCLLRI